MRRPENMPDPASNPAPDDLDTLFADSRVPEMHSELTDRIVLASRDVLPPQAANDRKPVIWGAMAGIAATLVAGALVLTNQPSEAELWAAQAEDAGFGDLYEWVGADTQ
ncbi:MAG: hypothetical protein AAF311_00960 [Pseudomonadota bacterium]